MYNKQRIEKSKNKLIKKKNNLLVQLYKLKNQQVVKNKAKEELGMRTLKPSQIVLLPSLDPVDNIKSNTLT